MIYGNIVGGGSGFEETYIIEDIDGNTYTGVVVDDIILFDAQPEDLKAGKVAASDAGIIVGTHECE